ncbi:hypothetical protein EDB86DRAFT_2352445 [Lactarius hatsudake]|nr:hypothetical protein EDB86DRAFT_2352445 [Lactarius hatsudake]
MLPKTAVLAEIPIQRGIRVPRAVIIALIAAASRVVRALQELWCAPRLRVPPDLFTHLDCAVPPGAYGPDPPRSAHCGRYLQFATGTGPRASLQVLTLCDRLPRPHQAQAPCVVVSSLRHLANRDLPQSVYTFPTHHLPDTTPSSTAPRARLPPPYNGRLPNLTAHWHCARAPLHPLVETRTVAPVLATLSQHDAPLPILVAVAGCPHTHTVWPLRLA